MNPIILKASGHDPEHLFKNAAAKLMALLSDHPESIKLAGAPEKICLAAENQEFLLADFLNQLLVRALAQKKIYTRIKILRLSEKSIDAQVFGVPAEVTRKAVSLQLDNRSIKTKRGLLTTQVSFKVNP